jgi:hypothetical protein
MDDVDDVIDDLDDDFEMDDDTDGSLNDEEEEDMDVDEPAGLEQDGILLCAQLNSIGDIPMDQIEDEAQGT